MRSTLFFIIIVVFVFSGFSLYAQPRFCGSDQLFRDQKENSVQSRKEHELFEDRLHTKALTNNQIPSQNQRFKFNLPIVLHVISPPGSAIGSKFNPENSVLIKGMNMLNEIFGNYGALYTGTGIDTEISFCMAQKKPDGTPFNGINRIESQLVNGNLCQEPSTSIHDDAAIKNLGSWDCCRYINVYLVTKLNDDVGCGLLGYATFPGTSCNGIDGIVVESATWSDPYAMKVMAHEVGHFLGLYHTFHGGCSNNDCLTEGDRICDTPPDRGTFTPCPDNTCNTDANAGFPNPFASDVSDPTQNYMDYSTCFESFSTGQKSRMHDVLGMFRSCLTSSDACVAPFALDASLEDLEVLNICDLNACPVISVRNSGQNAIQQLTFRVRIGNQVFSQSVFTNILSTEIAEFELDCRSANPGGIEISVEIIEVNSQADENQDNNLLSISFDLIEPISTPQFTTIRSACGFNGKIYVDYSSSVPVEITLWNSDGDSLGTGNVYTELIPGMYLVILRSFTHPDCFQTHTLIIEDDCPPCISGVINNYATVTAINCNGNIEVETTKGFNPGDQVLMIQMKGAIVSTLNDSTAGSITDIGVAGNYEINIIDRIVGNTIWFKYLIEREYDVEEIVQIVTIPVYDNAVVCNLTAKEWNGRTGGILIMDVKGKIDIVGNIDVSFKGFRGGQVSRNYYDGFCNFPQYNISQDIYGQKGEGVTTAFENTNFGMGRNASGGGGGNPVNSGGGGGSNAGAGGNGGYQWDSCLLSGGQQNGLGGSALNNAITNGKLFLGGGGGGGQQNDLRGSSGGHGGGMIIIKAQTIEISNAVLRSDGASVPSLIGNKTHDGQGGGGAGGTIIVDAQNLIGDLNLVSIGGTGANPTDTDNLSMHGPGGGGGGGYLGLKNIVATSDVRPGMSGFNSNNMSVHGAGNGQQGIVNYDFNLIYSSEVWLPVFSIERTSDCSGNTARLCFGDNPVDFQINDQPLSTGSCTEVLESGAYHVRVILAQGCEMDTTFFIDRRDTLSFDLIEIQSIICEQSGQIVIKGKGGNQPYFYSLDGGPQNTTGTFDNLTAGDYVIKLTDSDGCFIETEIALSNLTPLIPELKLDSIQHIYCDGDTAFLKFSLNAADIQPDFILINGPDSLKNDFGIFVNLQPGTYFLILKDQYGCVYEYGPYEILNFAEPTTKEILRTICPGEGYILVDGTIVHTAGEYMVRIPQPVGCDSIYQYKIDTFQVSPRNISESICEGDFFIFGPDTLSFSGSYEFIDLDENGCGRKNYLELTVIDTSMVSLVFEKCENDSILVGNKQYTEAGTYTEVILNHHMCDSTIQFEIRNLEPYFCVPCLVFIPDAFTPNGDGINDVFQPYPNYVNFTSFQIYNRWGGLIYETTDPHPKWDGRFKGKQLDTGVYIFILKGICLNGEQYQSRGEVTLFK